MRHHGIDVSWTGRVVRLLGGAQATSEDRRWAIVETQAVPRADRETRRRLVAAPGRGMDCAPPRKASGVGVGMVPKGGRP